MAARMTPWLDDGDVRLYHGDALKVLRELPDGSVDCVVTSPPYWGLRDYGIEGQLGLEPTPDLFVANMVAVFREIRRVLADHGTCWVNLGDSYSGGKTDRDDQDRNQRNIWSSADPSGAKLTKEPPGRNRPVPAGLKPKDLVGIPWRVAFALQQPYYTGRIKSESDRIWLAATIEAEGCLFIHKRKAGTDSGAKFTKKDGTRVSYARTQDTFGSGLEVSSTDRVIVERCMALTGVGSICEQSPEQNARRKQTIYRWNVRSNECRWIIQELYPHLYAKQHEARLLIGCPASGKDAEKAHESLKAIHQGGTPTIDFPTPASLFEEGWCVRSDVIWAKKNCMPESVTDRPTKSHEYIFMLTKLPRYWFDAEAVREPLTPSSIERGYSYRDPAGYRGAKDQNRDAMVKPEFGHGYMPSNGRNIRSVWNIATQPYTEAHFATFPEELARRCILAGCPTRVCRVCGKPSERIVTHGLDMSRTQARRAKEIAELNGLSSEHIDALKACGISDTGKALVTTNGTGKNDPAVQALADHARSVLKGYAREFLIRGTSETTGWSDCKCLRRTPGLPPSPSKYRPGVVLDPFIGSGTVAKVARDHGRHAIGIDLSSEYLELAARRLQQLSLLTEPYVEPVTVHAPED